MGNETTPEERLAADLSAGEPGECGWCQRAPGLILLGTAAVLGYIGLDILTGGWLTRTLAGGLAAAPSSASAVTVAAGEVVTGDGADES